MGSRFVNFISHKTIIKMTPTKLITGLLLVIATHGETQTIPDNAISYGYYRIDTIPTKSDTAKVIMLVCDTLVKNTSVHFNDGKNYVEYSPAGFTFWIYGFVVTRYDPFSWSFINEYFDRYKKPLNRNVIVWQSKLLNQ